MKKFRVYGNVNVVVTKEVWANDEDEALEKAYEKLPCLSGYCGNGGYDKLVGVSEHDETVELFDDIEYNEAEFLENDPSYVECPECGEELEEDQEGIFYCSECDLFFNSDGEEVDSPYDIDED